MTLCRVCGAGLQGPDYTMPAPAMTSTSTRLAIPTEVWVCWTCGHTQSADLPDISHFYANEYRISLQSEEHDQLYEMGPNGPVFRTEHQAAMLLDLDIPKGAKVLDFGAAKASTLRRLVKARPDVIPHVFDVSDDYRAFWVDWILSTAQATHELPTDWTGTFDLITAHFVLEHVARPVATLKDLARCIAPDGMLFFTVPDPIGNPGDLLVVDHLNHFVPSSIRHALDQAGLRAVEISADRFRGAFVVTARHGHAADDGMRAEPSKVLHLLDQWKSLLDDLTEELARPKWRSAKIALYGAGFYGALFTPLLGNRLIGFLDMNPNLQGADLDGKPVFAPDQCPDVDLVVVALNPAKSRQMLSGDLPWLKGKTEIFFPGQAWS